MSAHKILDKKHKDVMDYKSSLNFVKCEDKSTYVFILVSHVDQEKNDLTKLSCKAFIALNGYPQGTSIKPCGTGYVYDCVNDSYVISCIDFFPLGLIPFYFKLKLNGVGMWESIVPIPEKILIRCFSKEQKSFLENYKSLYSNSNFNLNFLQFLID